MTNGPVEVQVGGFIFKHESIPEDVPIFPLWIDDLPIISFHRADEHLFFNIQLFDAENNAVLIVRANELVLTTEHWDIEYVGRTITIRSAPRELLVTLTVDPAGAIRLGRGRVLANGVEIELWDECAALINNRMMYGGRAPMTYSGWQFGVAFGRPPQGVVFATVFSSIPRYDVDFVGNRRIMKDRRRSILAT